MAVQTTERTNRLPLELLLLATVGFLWGAQFGFTKIQLETMPPVTSVAIRLMFGALFMWGIVLAHGATVPGGLTRWRDFAIQGLLTSAGPGVLIAWGQQYVDSALAAILHSTSPILVMLITLLYTRQESIGPALRRPRDRPRRRLDDHRLRGAQGIDRGFADQIVIMAATFGTLSATLFAAASQAYRRSRQRPPPSPARRSVAILAMIVERPLAVDPSARSLAATVVGGALCNGVGSIIYFRLIRTLGSLGTSTVSFLKAAFGVVIGCFVLGEPFTASIAIGLSAVLIGVAAVNEGAAKAPPRS